MTSITQFNSKPCPKIDALDVDAYFDLSLDEINNNLLVLDTSWGCTKVDLSPAVKSAETITHLFIADGNLQYNREDYGREGAENGGVDCLTGYDLSRIISLQCLKDVDQNTPPRNGDTYIFNSNTGLFETFALGDFVENTNNTLEQHGSSIGSLEATLNSVLNSINLLTQRVAALEKRMTTAETNITNLQQRMTTAESNITNLRSRVSTIEDTIARPAGVPTDTRIVWGNINYNSDYTNTNQKTSGLYTHSTSTTKINDAYDA